MFQLSVGVMLAQQTSQPSPPALPLAFPGAEGYGKYTSGGRGGKVMVVTNLQDNGPGSFRAAAEAKGKRVIVFALSGTIHLERPLTIRGDVTIAGQTAPGDGICLADHPVGLGGDNAVIRYLRFRMGDRNEKNEMVDGNGGNDAFGFTRRKNVIIDHCSMSWSTDEAFSVYSGDSTTLQWNLIAEPLNYSYHFEKGDKDFEHHGFGAIWGGNHFSAHHNLFAHCQNRTPRFNGIRTSPEEFADYRNNVIYNWGGNNIYAGEGGRYNIVGNYFKYGPDTKNSVRSRIVNPGRTPTIPYGQWYVNGNYVDEAPTVSKDNRLGIHFNNEVDEAAKSAIVVDAAFSAEPIPAQSAEAAFTAVLQQAGASFRRDTLDARIVRDVQQRTGKFIDVQGGFPHGTPYEISKIAWPVLQSLPSKPDRDQDGMPDDWEIKMGLNPDDPRDAAACKLHSWYTNIEVYINSLTEQDTPFTAANEYNKLIKTYPGIRLVEEMRSPAIAEKRNIVYCRQGQRDLLTDAFYPAGKSKVKRKAIIIVHGGGWRSGNRQLHYPLAQRLAALGYVCFTPEYRLSGEALYPAAVLDLKACVRWARQVARQYDLDTAAIVVLGHSAGGELAAFLGVTNGNAAFEDKVCNASCKAVVNAVIDIDGTLSFVHPESGEGDDSKKISAATAWLGSMKKDNPALWTAASPLTHAGPQTPPVLFLNSSVDRMHAGRDDFAKVLDQYHIYHVTKTFQGAPHSFCLFEPWFSEMVTDIDAFVQKVFKGDSSSKKRK